MPKTRTAYPPAFRQPMIERADEPPIGNPFLAELERRTKWDNRIKADSETAEREYCGYMAKYVTALTAMLKNQDAGREDIDLLNTAAGAMFKHCGNYLPD